MSRSTRREVLGAAAVGAAALAAPPAWARVLSRRPGVGPGRFRDGVASGEPTATGISFWSRLDTARPRSGARLIVARDSGMRRVVATRVVPTGRSINGTLKTRIGRLKPDSEYFYVWESGTDVSPVGRTRTAPDPTSSRPLNIGFSSCQSYPHGFYGAHAHAAAQDLDLYVFLGDYIYAEDRIPTEGDVREDLFNANDLRSYRRKYRLYRSDAGLRELHRVHPAMHIWDDHEVENNYTDNRPAPSPLQRTAAYRAAFEWVPHAVYRQDRFRIYKKMSFGRTADVFFLDDRQYRTVDENDRPVLMLGEQQMQWLIAGLQASQATWKVIAQQVVVAPMNFGNGPSTDSWGGFDNSRTRLLSAIERAGIPNVVFLTGDAHTFMVNYLASDANSFKTNPNRRASAIEYVGGSVTSPGSDRSEATARATNPWTKQYNGMQHGYAHMALDGSNLVTEYRRTDLSRPDGATTTFERFTQPAGANAIQRESFPV